MFLILVFIGSLLVSNIFVPALFGPKVLLSMPIFLLGLFFYGKDPKTDAVKALVFSLAAEFLSGIPVGNLTIPLMATVLLYLGISELLNIKPALYRRSDWLTVIIYSFYLILLVLAYSLIFIFYDSGFDWKNSLMFWLDLFYDKETIISTIPLSILWTTVFKYILKFKEEIG